jgi:hypothetical protein
MLYGDACVWSNLLALQNPSKTIFEKDWINILHCFPFIVVHPGPATCATLVGFVVWCGLTVWWCYLLWLLGDVSREMGGVLGGYARVFQAVFALGTVKVIIYDIINETLKDLLDGKAKPVWRLTWDVAEAVGTVLGLDKWFGHWERNKIAPPDIDTSNAPLMRVPSPVPNKFPT